ncbi:MAG TPA: phosphoribosylamine--glycine ligase [Casimicrobiaceae bacterium]|jgi:phosphoribosylamine--glycine ligase|nr:phosphoribosylamine--glycine ligase [Casimicrobiaceae bacterium]
MNALVIGGGGREHALAWRVAQSPRVGKVFVAPGNAGTAREPGMVNVPLTDIATLVAFARRENVRITIVGPEAPLAAGIVDAFRAAALPVFGPTRAAAQLESSKDFAKAFMARHRIPTADYATFTDAAAAHAYVDAHGAPIVVKADGLAAGKGVVVAANAAEAHAAIDAMLVDHAMGGAGARIVIEAFLAGEEASFIVMVDGRNVLPLASSQDHKRLLDGDRGPNTGGMGAYSPAPVVTPAMHARIMREIIMPTVNGMAADGLPYTGFLYAGVMIDGDGRPRTLEFNCRLGDPETQPIMMRMKSDIVELVQHALDGTLDKVEAQWDRRTALGVVVAAAGYPDAPRSGDVIHGLDRGHDAADAMVKVFHAGTVLDGDDVKVNGGRVLCVTALGDSVRQAQKHAYDTIAGIGFDGMQYRTDIGHRALAARKG